MSVIVLPPGLKSGNCVTVVRVLRKRTGKRGNLDRKSTGNPLKAVM